jgi:hypothetical protein
MTKTVVSGDFFEIKKSCQKSGFEICPAGGLFKSGLTVVFPEIRGFHSQEVISCRQAGI